MRASTRRAIRAIVCWPLGIVLVVVWQLWPMMHLRGQEGQMESRMYAELSTESRSYSSSKALTPVSSSSVVTFLVLLLGPGLLATHSWWTRRKEQE